MSLQKSSSLTVHLPSFVCRPHIKKKQMSLKVKFPKMSFGPLSPIMAVVFVSPMSTLYQVSKCTEMGFFDFWENEFIQILVGTILFPAIFMAAQNCTSRPKFIKKYGLAIANDKTAPETIQFFWNIIYFWMSTFAVKHTIKVIGLVKYVRSFAAGIMSTFSFIPGTSAAGAICRRR